MVARKTTKSETAAKKTATAKRTVAKKVVTLDALNVGFRAGDVYQALAAAEKALTVKEIAKAASIAEEEVYLGMGWLFKEGKIVSSEDNKVALA